MNSEVKLTLEHYPKQVQGRLLELRQLIIDKAQQLELGKLEESLKWGEPSYKVPNGSPIRMDWKANEPLQYSLYFQCQSRLVETFKELYCDELQFQGNRAIVLDLNQPLPAPIPHCIELALTYHKVKHLPLLGA